MIHSDAVIGVNSPIFRHVTIGSRTGAEVPVIGGHVDIGAGAKILGNVIGANAIVTKSVLTQGAAVGTSAN